MVATSLLYALHSCIYTEV